MIFTGKMINAEEAYKIGLVNDVINLTQEELPEAPSEGEEVKRKEYEKGVTLLNDKLAMYLDKKQEEAQAIQ